MDTKDPRVLLAIDDKRDNLIALKAVIGDAFPGTTLLTAQSGSDGIALALTENPDVILLDLLMPGMDGFEVCRQMKSDPRLAEIPVLFLTATQSDPITRAKVLAVGGEGCLSKPIEEVELVTKVRAITKIRVAATRTRLEKGRLAAGAGEQAHAQQALHQRAEAAARDYVVHDDSETRSPEDTQRLLQDLRVHQIEMQMQNEELRQAQVTLEESRARYLDLYDLAPVGYLRVSEHGLILEANLTVDTLLGVGRRDLIGQALSRFIVKDDQTSLYLHFRQLTKIDVPPEWAMRMVTRTGTPFWAHLQATRAQGEGGVPDYRIVMSDITERKQAEELQRASAVWHEAILMTAMDGFWLVDTQGRLREVNQTYVRMSGYSVEELLSLRIPDLEAAETAADITDHIQKVMRLGEDRFETKHRRKDGSVFDVEVSVQFRSGEDGMFVYFLRDITARKQAEERQATFDALLQAKKMESVGRLAGGVAHEFNNMLGVILGHAEIALLKVDPAQPLYQNLLKIQHAGERSAALTRQLLTLARKQIIVPQVLQTTTSVSEILSLVQRLIGEDVPISWQPDAAVWPIWMDPSQLDQILTSLCLNARDATAGVGTITITASNRCIDAQCCATNAQATPGDYMRISVTDTGHGMDQTTIEHIFEPFFTTKGIGWGSGLGLATVDGAVRQNHGFITVSSVVGHGTTFEIFLPRHLADQAKTPEKPDIPAVTAERGHETILVVDDEPEILAITAEFLAAQGYVVLDASGPKDAIRLAQAHPGPIDLLLTDVLMPGMNGQELANALVAFFPRVKRLFMSGYTADFIASQGLVDAGVRFLQKPFRLRDLLSTVREALDADGE